uniref:F-box domain-containing protein n=1 Tax=Caenorhabditis tropicalis TaxID=1561998 RepID=A0A1I7UTP8_9PELO
MDLLRLPLLVLIEVFKNMDFYEKFWISLLSKRAKKTMKLTCVIPYFSFGLTESFDIHWEQDSWNNYTERDYCIGGIQMTLNFRSFSLTLLNGTYRQQLVLAGHLLDSFKVSEISVAFTDPTLSASVLEFMKMINQRQVSIQKFSYQVNGDSSEFIPRILDECTEVTDFISISAFFPDDFVYIPSRKFKATSFYVGSRTNWFDLGSFMNCRRITMKLSIESNRTVQCWSSIFTKWMDSDVGLQRLTLTHIEESGKQLIMEALSHQGTSRFIEEYMTEMKRRDGSEFFIYAFDNFIVIHTKQAYLERLRILSRARNPAN